MLVLESCQTFLLVFVVSSVWSRYHHTINNNDPHSFPTRRSSDLTSRASLVTGVYTTPSLWRCNSNCSSRCDDNRSEEHTSDLRSPDWIVCRTVAGTTNSATRRPASWRDTSAAARGSA